MANRHQPWRLFLGFYTCHADEWHTTRSRPPCAPIHEIVNPHGFPTTLQIRISIQDSMARKCGKEKPLLLMILQHSWRKWYLDEQIPETGMGNRGHDKWSVFLPSSLSSPACPKRVREARACHGICLSRYMSRNM